MKFTSKDLMKAMGLQVGDKIKSNGVLYLVCENDEDEDIGTHTIYRYYLRNINKIGMIMLEDLIGEEYEILPRPKRVGDLKCEEIDNCRKCPLHYICFIKIDQKNDMNTTLEQMLNSFTIDDQEIYNLLKARLDKEVKE